MSTSSSSTADAVQPTTAPTNYYADDQKLTFDDAEILVERYFRQDVPRSVTRVKHVLTEFDMPYSNHNHHRVLVALRERCEKHNPERSGPTRFVIPERYQDHEPSQRGD